MSTECVTLNKALAIRWFDEVWNKGNSAAIAEMFHPDGLAHGFPEPDSELQGPAAFAAVHKQFLETFSNISLTVDELVAEDDKVAVVWTAYMKHSGEGLGFAATGRDVAFKGSSVIRVGEGKILEGWNFLDFTRVVLNLQMPEQKSQATAKQSRPPL